MAFGNGVFMRGPNYWAWAREDGTIVDAPVHTLLKRHRWLRAPVLRSAVTLAEMVTLTFTLHRRNGAWRGTRFLAWLVTCMIADFCLGSALPYLVHGTVPQHVLLGMLDFAFGLLALRFGLGKDIWRYHGAEHKAVNAYENGADLGDVQAAMTYSRIHDRCGTNLAVLSVLLLLLGYPILGSLPLGGIWGLLYGVFILVLSLEFFRLITKWPRSPLSRVFLAGGKALQRSVTTREPAPEHMELACLALGRVLELEHGEA